jgi:hypothetical protein
VTPFSARAVLPASASNPAQHIVTVFIISLPFGLFDRLLEPARLRRALG